MSQASKNNQKEKMTIFALFCGASQGFIYLRHQVWKQKNLSFFPLICDWDNKGEDCVFVKLPTYAISVSLTIELHKNNTDTPSVTNKQYYKIILF